MVSVPGHTAGYGQGRAVLVLACCVYCTRVCTLIPRYPFLSLFGNVLVVVTWFLLSHIRVCCVRCVCDICRRGVVAYNVPYMCFMSGVY